MYAKLRVIDRAYAPLKIDKIITNQLAITWMKISQMEMCMSAIKAEIYTEMNSGTFGSMLKVGCINMF